MTPSPVTVLGLGAMGQALAHAFLAAGHPTTVWNRSPGRADALVAAGAVEASDAASAVASAPLVVVCVLDRTSVDAVLDAADVAVAGRTIVNLTSGVPGDGRAVEVRVTAAGGTYLDGKIMVPTPLVGTEHALVIYAGDRTAFDAHLATLRAIGPDADHLGTDPGLAATYDLGMLDVFFNGMAAFLHAVALVEGDRVDARTFLPYATRVVDVLKVSMEGLADDVDRSEHPGTEDNLVMDTRALDHIVEVSRARGLDTSVPATVRALAQASIEAGHGADGFSRVVDAVRRPVDAAREDEPAA